MVKTNVPLIKYLYLQHFPYVMCYDYYNTVLFHRVIFYESLIWKYKATKTYLFNIGFAELSSIFGIYTNICRKNTTHYLAAAIWQVVCPILCYYITASDSDSVLVQNLFLFHFFLYFHGIYCLHMRVKYCIGMHTNVGLRTKQFRFMSKR